jgi:hypothetical protein
MGLRSRSLTKMRHKNYEWLFCCSYNHLGTVLILMVSELCKPNRSPCIVLSICMTDVNEYIHVNLTDHVLQAKIRRWHIYLTYWSYFEIDRKLLEISNSYLVQILPYLRHVRMFCVKYSGLLVCDRVSNGR